MFDLLNFADILRLELFEVAFATFRLTVNPSVFNQARSLTIGSVAKLGGAVKLASSSEERPQSPRLAEAKADGATFSAPSPPPRPTWLKPTVSSAVCIVTENSGFWLVASLTKD